MNLQTYLEKTNTKTADFARSLGVSPNLVYQWAHEIRPVAIRHCKAIEDMTKGDISRQDLRASDWHLIWPELGS
ncbi:DNA-binding transcriptional regulator YdaS (Cro superfamily) [Oxalobacteraceae bacterium GrIS 1.11]